MFLYVEYCAFLPHFSNNTLSNNVTVLTVPICSSLAVNSTQVIHSLCLNSKLLLLYMLAEVFPDCSMSS